MEKIYLPDVDRYEISCTKEYYLHEIGSEDYPEIRKARVKAVDVDRWEEVLIADIPPYTKEQYKAKVVELIRERYDINKEMEIQREMLDALLNPAPMGVDDTDAGTTDVVVEFNVYNDYVEECKRRAKELLMEKGGETDDTRS